MVEPLTLIATAAALGSALSGISASRKGRKSAKRRSRRERAHLEALKRRAARSSREGSARGGIESVGDEGLVEVRAREAQVGPSFALEGFLNQAEAQKEAFRQHQMNQIIDLIGAGAQGAAELFPDQGNVVSPFDLGMEVIPPFTDEELLRGATRRAMLAQQTPNPFFPGPQIMQPF